MTNDAFRGADSHFFTYYFANQSDATAFALSIQDDANNAANGAGTSADNHRSVVHGPDGHLYVASGLSIQAAVDASHDGDTVNVAAGTYDEAVVINTAGITLSGAQAGVAGADHTGAETVIHSDSNSVVTVFADNVTLDGIKVTGDATYGVSNGHDDGDGRYAAINGLTLTNSVIDGPAWGVQLYNADYPTNSSYSYSGVSTFNTVTGNLISHSDIGVVLYNDAYASVTGNSLTDVGVGIQTGNDYQAAPSGHTPEISDNDIAANDVGIFHNLQYDNATAYQIDDNTVVAGADPTADNVGIIVWSISNPGGAEVSGNSVSGFAEGYELWNDPVGVTIHGGSISDNAIGIAALDDSTYGDAADSHYAIDGVQFAGNTTDIEIQDTSLKIDDSTGVSNPTTIHLDGTGQFDPNGFSGELSVTGDDADHSYASGDGDDHIHGGAGEDTVTVDEDLSGASITYDATTNTWTVVTADHGADSLDGVEKITDSNGHTYLLVDPHGSYTSIQDAVDAAGDGDTILIGAGTYREQVVIDGKALHLVGADGAVIEAPDTLTTSFTNPASGTPSKMPVIAVINGADVTIDNIDVDGRGAGSAANGGGFDGVAFYNSDGAYLNGHISDVRNGGEAGTLDGVQHGNGVYIASNSGAHSVEVGNSTIDGFQKTGIVADGAGLTVDLHDNIVTGTGLTNVIAQNGIQVSGGATGDVDGNHISGIGYDGPVTTADILVYGAGTGLSIDANTLSAPDAAPYAAGVYFYNTDGGSVTHNDITDTTWGVAQDGTFTNVVTDSGNTYHNVDAAFGFYASDATTSGYEVTGTGQADDLEGGGGADTLHGAGGDDYLDGYAGNDVLDGGAGNDTLVGDAGTDTAHVGTGASFAIVSDQWTVTSTDGSDTLSGVEQVSDGTRTTLLVGDGGYATIQAAVDAAHAGDTILVAAGTYAEQVVIHTSGLTLQAVGEVTLQGSFKSDNHLAANASVADFLATATSFNGAAGSAFKVGADHVTLDGFNIDGYANGVFLDTGADNAALKNLDITDSIDGIHKGTTIGVHNLSILGGSISDGYIGIDFAKSTAAGDRLVGLADGVTLDGTSFSHLDAKGIYAEALSNAHLTNFTMTDVGQQGAGPAFGAAGSGGDGVDLNLKNGDYSNVEIDHFTLTNVGSSDKESTVPSQINGGAIVIEARDQGSYASAQGHFTGAVSIHDGVITGHTSVGIQVGEPNQSNADPDVTVSNVSISGAQHSAQFGDIANESDSSILTVTGTSGADSLIASGHTDGAVNLTGGAGDDTLGGGSNADTFNGGANADSITGGAGSDVATYAHDLTAANLSYDHTHGYWVVDAGAEGIDHVTGVERLQGPTHSIWLVGDGLATLQQAVSLAAAGDTIVIANGSYTLSSTLNIDKSISIVGESEAGVVIHGASLGYGMNVTGDHVTLSDFTFVGSGVSQSGNYGIKVEPDTGAASDRVSDFSLSHVTVEGFGRAEIDLNGVVGASLTGVTANGQGTAGAGVAITDSINVTLTDLTTSGNAWGSVALQPTNHFYDEATSNIVFAGTYSHDEAIAIYVDDESGTHDLGAITFPPSFSTDGDGVWSVTNDAFRGADSHFFTYYFANQADATAFALSIQDDANNASNGAGTSTDNHRSVVHGPDGHLYVASGLSIQAAVDASHDGDTVNVGAGTFTENLNISKAITLDGAMAGHDAQDAGRGLTDGAGETNIVGRSDITAAGNVTIDGVRFVNDATTTNGGPSDPTLWIGNAAANRTVEHSIFYSTVSGAAHDDRAIYVSGSAGTVSLDDNTFSGSSHSGFSSASWGRAVWFDGGGVDISATGNTFEYVRSGLNLDMGGASHATVSDNSFHVVGTGMAVGTDTDGLTVSSNHFDGTGEEFNFRNQTGPVTFDASGAVHDSAGLIDVLGGDGADTLTGTAGSDLLDGNQLHTAHADNDSLYGGDGDDYLIGRGGDDSLYGGAGNDTAVYAGPASSYTIGMDGGGHYTSVSGPEGTDTLSGVEQLAFNGGATVLDSGKPVQLYDASSHLVGTFDTIQAAINAAGANYDIKVAAGTYHEALTVGVAGLTIDAAPGAVLEGSFKETNGAAGSVYDFLKTATSYSYGPNGVTISASGVTINGLHIDNFGQGVMLGDNVNGLTLDGVAISSFVNGLQKGTTADIHDLTLNDVSFSDGQIGVYFAHTTTPGQGSDGVADGILFDGVTFTDILQKGIYVETLTNAHLTDIDMTHVGQYGGVITAGSDGQSGAGINLNLKNGVFQNVEIDNFHLTNTGASDRDGLSSSHANGGALVLEARDDGGTYGAAPASFVGSINVHDGVIDGHTSTGIHVGEPGKANADPDVTVTNVTISGAQHNALHGEIGNEANGATLTFNGSASADSLTASGNSDGAIVLNGLGGDDHLTGGGGTDSLNGGDGADVLDGGVGADSLSGGLGDDTYVVDNAADQVNEASNAGTDTVQSSITYTLSPAVENLTLTGSAAIDGTGNGSNNVIIGNSAANSLHGMSGDDLLIGGGGADSLDGGDGTDTASYAGSSAGVTVSLLSAGAQSGGDAAGDVLTAIENLIGSAQADTLTGSAGINELTGGAGDDVLDGKAGADTMYGGAGNDTFYVDDSGDTVVEAASQGHDTVYSSVSHTLEANVEDLVLTGTAANGTGNDLANSITGDASANILTGAGGDDLLDGRAGADIMIGGLGDDTYVVDNAGDVVTEQPGEGHDLVRTALNAFTLGANLEDLTFTGAGAFTGTGNALANQITGGAGDDLLDGAAGADTLIGGAGNDTYVVDNAADVTVELAGGGTDLVTASVSYGLGDEVENLTLTGKAGISGTGNGLANVITGNTGANSLYGGGGDDTLNGKTGADAMYGGAGDDTYTVDNAGDTVHENSGEGTDLVMSTVTFTLSADVENLTLTGSAAIDGTGNDLDNIIIGNSGTNSLYGGAGADRLDGKTGADHMFGGAGDDTYVVDNAGDTVDETGGDGHDTVLAGLASYTLAAGLEDLTYTGTAAFTGTGNSEDNHIIGGKSADFLDGKAGADIMEGGLGNDTYYVDNVGDQVIETGTGVDLVNTTVDFTLGTGVENLTFIGSGDFTGVGNTLANIIIGGAGNDWLDGGDGADKLYGGLGDDTYVVDVAGDLITDTGGTDTVRAGMSAYVLGAGLENLTYTGAGNFTGTGNAAVNTITGGAGDDKLDGKAGADTLVGGLGDDTYYIDDSGDSVVEQSGEGTDLVIASVSYALGSDVENLTLSGTGNINATGNALDNILTGNTGNNLIDGGLGADTMVGGAGDDTYVVDNVGDTINDTSGTDTVQTTLDSYTLGKGLENVVFTGSGDFTGTGNTTANSLTGGDGDDVLDGKTGADHMIGGLGNDAYYVDNASDVVTEAVGQGQDVVFSTVSFTLSVNVENLTLIASGATNATGNDLDNSLTGNKAANRLDGGAGADVLTGGLGNDTFVFSHGQAQGDLVADFKGVGATVGDTLEFHGFGAGTITHIGVTDTYLVTADAAHGGGSEIIQLAGVTNLDTGPASNDYHFM